ncbi:MAG TPA: ABC transporter substrate-binding protein [Sedimentisphaerales bacterium]|nr:ABC transporter substrate-binding protein [Sedimentisphaerales bacterium]
MKRALPICGILLSLLLLTSCKENGNQTNAKEGGTKKIVIVTPLSHPSLDQSIDGFRQGLAEKDYTEANVEFIFMNASGDLGKIAFLVKSAIARKPSLIFVLTTPAAAESIKLTNPAGIPMVYTAVTDPVEAKIVTSMEKSETLATGVSDRYPVKEQVNMFMRILPTMKTAGLIYNPAEANSRILVKQTISALEENNIQALRYEVHYASEISSRVKQAILLNDCIIVNGDNLVTENLAEVINLCIQSKKPLFVGDPDSVRRGAIATVGPSYFAIGRQTGIKAAQILDGKDPRNIPSEYPRSFDYIINTKAAEAMGVKIPEDFWFSRQIWESRISSSK